MSDAEKSVVTREATFTASAEKLWSLVSDFGGLAGIMPGIESCEMEGEGVGA